MSKRLLNIVLLVSLFIPVIATAPPIMALLLSVMLIMALTGPARKMPWYMNLNGSVNITLENGQLGGLIQTEDGITGLILTGVSESGGYTLGTPILITGLASAAAAGISAANNPFCYKHLNDFYNEAGNGAQLYLMLVPNTVTVDLMASNSNTTNGAPVLLNYAIAQQIPIKVLGLCADDKAIHTAGGTITITNGMNAAVYTAATNMAVTAGNYFTAQSPFRCIIGGSSFAGSASALVNETSGTTNNRTAILIGDDQVWDATYTSAAVGLCLGLISTLPVQRKISRVRNGALTNTLAYLGPNAFDSASGATIAGKGYITFVTYPNVSGFYFSGDPMLTATTDDYCLLARGRVIDKVQVLAYTTFVQEVDDEVPVDSNGDIDSGFAIWLQQQINNQVNNNMTALGEISSFSSYINPAQNILTTNTLNVVLSVTPVGYATTIDIQLGFAL